jgi:hypothetical protein
MYYIYIDESGDSGDPKKKGSSLDFSMSACICGKNYVSDISSKVSDLILLLNKKELKYSKISKKDKLYSLTYLNKLKLNIKSVYFKKNRFIHKDIFEISFEELIKRLDIDKKSTVKFIIDGDENKFYRKMYEKIIKRYYKNFKLKFANSVKTPILQVSDFYAGYEREVKSKSI